MKTALVCFLVGLIAISLVHAQNNQSSTMAPSNSTTQKAGAVSVQGTSVIFQIIFALTGAFIFGLLRN